MPRRQGPGDHLGRLGGDCTSPPPANRRSSPAQVASLPLTRRVLPAAPAAKTEPAEGEKAEALETLMEAPQGAQAVAARAGARVLALERGLGRVRPVGLRREARAAPVHELLDEQVRRDLVQHREQPEGQQCVGRVRVRVRRHRRREIARERVDHAHGRQFPTVSDLPARSGLDEEWAARTLCWSSTRR